jgi:hypothetical protein
LGGSPRALSIAFWLALGLGLVAVPIYVLLATAQFALRHAWSIGALVPLMRTSAFGRGYLDLELLLAEDAPVVIAPDRHRRGTNALLLAPPSVISPAFGEDSFRAHREGARRASSDARIVTSRGLATDVDDPEDLQLLRREPGVGRRTSELLNSVAFSAASLR